MNKNTGCGMFIVLLILTMFFHVAGLFFNGWFLQCVYNIGLYDVCTEFGIKLPEVSYFTFMMIWVIFSVLIMICKGHELQKMINENKNTNEDITDKFVKVFESFINPILSKCIILLTMWVLHCLVF